MIRDYQKEDIQFALSHPRAGLFLDLGLGKTLEMLVTMSVVREKTRLPFIVVAPLRVLQEWMNEIHKWKVPLTYENLHLSDREEIYGKAHPDIFFINYDLLSWLSESKTYEERFGCVVFDESTKIKNWSSQRSKAARKLSHRADRCYILTGSPAPNSLQNLYPQTYVIDRGESLGGSFTEYRRRYFYQVGEKYYNKWELVPGREDDIYRAIRPFSIRRELRDHLNLPPVTVIDHPITLPPALMKTYRRFKRESLLELERAHVLASNAGVLMGKLRQFTGGTVLDGEGVSHIVHEEKIDALADLYEEAQGSPILVAYEYHHDRDAILKRMDAEYLDGTVSFNKGEDLKRRWNEGKIPLFLLQWQSGALGLNLQFGGHIIVAYSLPWDLESYMQLIGRLDRPGQKAPVMVHRLMCSGTIDEYISEVLAAKAHNQQKLLDALKD